MTKSHFFMVEMMLSYLLSWCYKGNIA